MELNQNELIGKLEKISALYKDTVAIRSEMDEFVPDDHYKREIIVPPFPGDFRTEEERMVWADRLDHTGAEAPEVAEQVHRRLYGPKEPEKPKIKEFVKLEDRELQKKQSKFGGLSILSAGVAVFFLLGTLLNLNDEYSVLPTLIFLTLIAAAAFLLFRFMAKAAKAKENKKNSEAMLAHKRRQEECMAEYEKKKEAYEKECVQYEDLLKKFMEDYRAWREIYIQSVDEETQIAQKLASDKVAAVEKIYEQRYIPAEAALNECNDLVSEEYLPVLKVIIDLLKSKRADNLKEAINLYEEMVYRERQLQLQREQEQQRQREEEQRRRDEERHHQEQMKFQQEQERQRRRDEEQRRRDEDERRARENKEREMRERKAANDAKREAERKCHWCTNFRTCGMKNNPPLNCTGFRPGSTHQI